MGVLRVQNTNVITSSSSGISHHTQNASQTTTTTTTIANNNANHNNNATIEIKQQPQATTTIQIQSPNQLANTAQVCLNAMDLNDVDVRTNKNFITVVNFLDSFFFIFCVFSNLILDFRFFFLRYASVFFMMIG